MRVRVEGGSSLAVERVLTEPFTIGRGPQATLHVNAGQVSRVHAEVTLDGARWVLRDAGSTNGVFVDDERVEVVPIEGRLVVRLGQDGPVVRFEVEAAAAPEARTEAERGAPFGIQNRSADRAAPLLPPNPAPSRSESGEGTDAVPAAPTSATERSGDSGETEPSVSQVIRRYFEADDDESAGDRTRRIRQAYQQVQAEQKRTYGGIIGGIAVLLIAALAFAIWQQFRVERLEQTAQELFYEMKEQDLMAAQLRVVAEEAGNAALDAQLDELEARRRRQIDLYEGYVEELGIYRSLSPEEREIYRVARIFNESEFSIPAGFVREVKGVIEEWQRSNRFRNAVRRAEESGYTEAIVRTMQQYGLPPEFFYLALQESNFDTCISGPETRWGIAKGMWQFIPTTAQAYGLATGPRLNLRVCDNLDERHDFEKSTEAAARYLSYIYTELAEASGLLVMASYNWGEHRVGSHLDRIPETPLTVVRSDIGDVPANPQARNYWRFLNEYRDRMPEETKNYVLHIFSAAVIGQNPRLFGFDFDNPLEPYL